MGPRLCGGGVSSAARRASAKAVKGGEKEKSTPSAWLSKLLILSYRSLRSQPASVKIRSSTSSWPHTFQAIMAIPPFSIWILYDSIADHAAVRKGRNQQFT